MDNGDNDIKHYTAEDITRYWQGKLSPQEMHAMEKAAMDDPFLADALEGYSTANAATVGDEVRELQTRLKERTSGATVVPLHKKTRWWTVAALLILLCGFGALMYNLFMQSENEVNKNTAAVVQKDTASTEATFKAADTVAAAATRLQSDTVRFYANSGGADSIAREENLTFTAPTTTEKDQYKDVAKNKARASGGYDYSTSDARSKPVGDTAALIAKTDDEAKTRRGEEFLRKENQRNDSPILTQNDSRRSVPESLQGRAAGIQGNNANNQARVPPARDNDQMDGLAFNNFSGRVLDRNNVPVPYATVRTNNATLTSADQNGNFNFRSFDSVLNLSATSVGFEPRQFTARNNQPVDVVLDRANSKLSEVVVTGAGSQKKREVSSASTLKVYVMDAEPVVGWDEYNKYIETNKRVAPMGYQIEKKRLDSDNAPVKGEVVVSFIVSKTGKLSNFDIDKSLGKQQDAEAIRLIKEGPAWRVLKNKKTRARVIIPF